MSSPQTSQRPLTSDGGVPPLEVRHVVFIGEAGIGKSSIINLLAHGKQAATSSDATPCTRDPDSYDVVIDQPGVTYRLWDTPGMHEASILGFKRSSGMSAVRTFLQERFKRGELDLLVFCIRGGRAPQSLSKTYKTFGVGTRQVAVPVVVAITNLEDTQPAMDAWWDQNEGQLKTLGLEFDGYACITSLPVHHRRRASQEEIRYLISTKCRRRAGATQLGPDQEYLPKDSHCVIC